jgi:hypothetical protein
LKLNKYPLFTFYFTLLILITSCSPYFYAPNTPQTPLFREKGETQISGHYGGGKASESFQLQMAAAIDSHLAVLSSLYKGYGEIEENYSLMVFGIPFSYYNKYITKMTQMEIAAGYFKTTTKKKSVEWFGGVSYGEVQNNYLRDYYNGSNYKVFPFEVKNNFIKPFIQRNFGYRTKYIDFILNNRMSFLHIDRFRETHHNDNGYTKTSDNYVDYVRKYPNSFLLESGITLRLGEGDLKVQLHLGTSINLSDFAYYQEHYLLSLGLVYKFKSGIHLN